MPNPVILCVVHDAALRAELARQLHAPFYKDYVLASAADEAEGLKVLADLTAHEQELPLVIFAQPQPTTPEAALHQHLRQQFPQTLKVYLLDTADDAQLAWVLAEPNLYRFLLIPWHPADLQLTLTEALQRYFRDKTLTEQSSSLQVIAVDLEKRVQKRAAEMAELYEASYAIAASMDMEQVYAAAHHAVAQLMLAEVFIISLHNEARQEIEFVYFIERSGRIWLQPVPVAGSLSGRVVLTGEVIHVNDLLQEPQLERRHFGEAESVRSILAVPLRVGGKLLGMLSAQSYQPYAYTADHSRVLVTLAGQVASTIDNARTAQLLRAQRDLFEKLVRMARAIGEHPDLAETLKNALMVVATMVTASNSSLFLIGPHGQVTHALFARGAVTKSEQPGLIQPVMNKGLAGWVAQHRTPTLVLDTIYDARWLQLPDQPYKVRSVLGVPILYGEDLLGILTLQHPEPRHFTAEHLLLMQSAADHIGLALRNARLFDQLQEAHARLDYLLKRFVPSQIARQLMEQEDLPQLGGERRVATIFFADIRGYTALADTLPPEVLLQVLNHHFAIIGQAVLKNGGVINQYVGDMLMASFNAPELQPDHALRAVEAAIEAQIKLRSWQRSKPDTLAENAQFGIGINTGSVVCGYIGFEDRFDYATLGRPTNVAFRFSALAKAGQILIGPETYEAVADQVPTRLVGLLPMKGRSEPVMTYEVMC